MELTGNREEPADLPDQQATEFERALKTARGLSLLTPQQA
jgi:hypothetical protein